MKTESNVPLYAAVLIGGKSRRMGQPKHLLSIDTKTWLERTVQLLDSLVERTVLVGAGTLPVSCASLPRLYDIPGIGGPMAGVLAAFRSVPEADWLILACDMPAVTEASVRWLLEGRYEESWGRVPRLHRDKKFFEPLFALYKSEASQIFETMFKDGRARIGLVAEHTKIETPFVPSELQHCWQNINTPEELLFFQQDEDVSG